MNFLRNSHIRQTIKSLFKAQCITAAVFLFLFALSHIGGTLYTRSLFTKETKKFQEGITQKEHYLTTQGNQIAQNTDLAQKILGDDRTGVLSVLKVESASTSIERLAVANSRGFIISRSAYPGRYGDNVFLSTPAGRAAAQGSSTQSIEMTGFGNQMFITTVRPITYSGLMVGVLFANQFLDDAYAASLRDNFLSPGTQVAFYSKQYGIYSNSFTATTTRNLITSYINSGSDWVSNGLSGSIVDFGDGNIYVVKNIIFPGLEKSPGGALLFIPRYDLSHYVNWTISVTVLIIFIIQALALHRRRPRQLHGAVYYLLLLSASVPVLLLSMFALQAYNISLLHLQKTQYALYNSTARLQPDFGIYQIGSEQSISIVVDTGDEEINAVSTRINFDPQRIDVELLDTTNSDCSYFVTNILDTTNGSATLSCIILDTKTGQKNLTIGSLILKAKTVGTFTLSFDQSETQVFANDGLGTDVLRMAQDSSYRVDNYDPSLIDTSSTNATTSRSFILFSPTHPNQSRWYNSPAASFVWIGKPNAAYLYAFDSSPDTTPTHTITKTHIDIPLPGDGVFYFHLQLASGGPIAHYRVQADTVAPHIVSIQASQQHIQAGQVVRFSFHAEDMASGVQRNYYINFGDHLFLPIGPELYVPFLKQGDYAVTLRVYDGAGNYSEKTQIIHVSGN